MGPQRRLRDPGEIAALIARHVTPVASLLFFGASAPNLVALYAIDTLLCLFLFAWLVMNHITETRTARAGGVPGALKLGAAALVVGSLFGAILVGPVAAVLASYGWFVSGSWRQPGFHAALAAQAVGTGYAMLRLHRFLRETKEDDRYLGEQFKLLVARWVLLLGVVFLGVASFLGAWLGGILIVLVYSGASIYFELSPEKAHEMFHGRKAPPKAPGADKTLPLP
jgi:hypothetical protein